MNYDFFFQAEDGIRDLIVTGVQTCALPIWATKSSEVQREVTGRMEDFVALGIRLQHPVLDPVVHHLHVVPGADRKSRRVGKECRCRWWPHDCRQKVCSSASVDEVRT